MTKAIRVRSGIVFFLVCLSNISYAQQVLDRYAAEGLKSNSTIDKLKSDYQGAIWALEESKKMFGPNVDFTAGYTRNMRQPIDLTGGGSTTGFADFLNELQTSSIKNGKFYYPSTNQISSAVQLTQNIFNRQLAYTKRIKEENTKVSASQLEDFRTELDADIRDAYFQYLEAAALAEAIQRSIIIARQNLRGIEQMLAQQKLTKESLYKSRANLGTIESQLRDMETTRLKAQYYFNFLLNKTPQDSIEADPYYVYRPSAVYHLSDQKDMAESGYHTRSIQQSANSAGLQQELIRAQNLPVLQFKGTAGISGSHLSFDNGRLPYGALEVSLKWNIFNSGVNHSKSRQAFFQQQGLSAQYQNSKKQQEINELSGYLDVVTQLEDYRSVKANYQNSAVYCQAVQTKFMMGLATVLELLDAENGLQQADMDRLKWYYVLQIRITSYQKNTGKKIKLIQ